MIIDGKVYENAKWIRVDGLTVSMSHKKGLAYIPLDSLTDTVLKNDLRLDPKQVREASAKAKVEAEQKRKEVEARNLVNARREAQRKEDEKVGIFNGYGEVIQVISDGLLVQPGPSDRGQTKVLLVGHPNQEGMTDGKVLIFRAKKVGIFSYVTVLGSKATIEKWECLSAE